MAIQHATPVIIVILASLGFALYYYIGCAKKAPSRLFIRRIGGIDAIESAVGRAVEQGRPIFFTTALTTLGPVLYACMGVLSFVARKAAVFRSSLIVPQSAPDALALVEDVVSDAYRAERRWGGFDPSTLPFLSEDQFAFASGYIGMVHRDRPATAFLMGNFAAESLILAEAGQYVGATQVAASVSPEQIPFFVCTCDYTLIGEELFSASAYLSKEPVLLGSLYGQDRAKLALILLLTIGIIFETLKQLIPAFRNTPDIVTLLLSITWDSLTF
jgi:hypothetical protein